MGGFCYGFEIFTIATLLSEAIYKPCWTKRKAAGTDLPPHVGCILIPKGKGSVLLLDNRFMRNDYRQLLPPHWNVRPMSDVAKNDDLKRSRVRQP